jgi:RecA-family ATPase
MATAAAIDFVPLMAPIARRLLGEPNTRLSTKRELRWGAKGSMSVDLDKGTWFDHEAKLGGGGLDLIKRERRCGTADAFAWMEAEGLKEPRADNDCAPVRPTASTFYDYRDADGAVAYRVERRGKAAERPFLQHGPDGRGGFHSAKGCMEAVERLPYRLPEILAANPNDIIFIVEGEKDADNLHRRGLIATTNSGGAGKFGEELVAHFVGRRVVILPDNDPAGRDHADDVAAKLAGVAAELAILPCFTSAEKSDVSDWLAAGGSAFELTRMAEDALRAADATFPIADLAAWANIAPTPKAFFMPHFVPANEVVVVTGDGGTNKSTFALQLATCSAAGKPMLGYDVTSGPALYVTAEDDDRENHWRLAKMAQAIGTSLQALAGRLGVVSLRGRLNNELAIFDQEGKLHTTQAYALLRSTIRRTGAKLLVLDNVAHLFAGNENDRAEVTAFINLLYQLCRDFDVTLLLIAHRNKAGDNYSGSTAWLNAVRSQIMLERHDEHDADARRLSLGKANYARAGETIEFRWHDFALIRNEDLPTSARAELAATLQASAENDHFLRCLAAATEQKRAVSHIKGTNYYATAFARMTEGKGAKPEAFERAFERLMYLRTIEVDADLWKDQHYHWKRGIRLAGGSPDNPATPAATPSGDPRQPQPQALENTTGAPRPATPPYMYISGAAFEAGAPEDEERPRSRGGMILAQGESEDDEVPGWPS